MGTHTYHDRRVASTGTYTDPKPHASAAGTSTDASTCANTVATTRAAHEHRDYRHRWTCCHAAARVGQLIRAAGSNHNRNSQEARDHPSWLESDYSVSPFSDSRFTPIDLAGVQVSPWFALGLGIALSEAQGFHPGDSQMASVASEVLKHVEELGEKLAASGKAVGPQVSKFVAAILPVLLDLYEQYEATGSPPTVQQVITDIQEILAELNPQP